jgi:hypothetical protein
MLFLEFDIFRQAVAQLIAALPAVGGAICLVVFGIWFAHIIRSLFNKLFISFDLDTKTQNFIHVLGIESNMKWKVSERITRLVYYVIILFTIAAAAQILGLSIIAEQIATFTNFLPYLFTALIVIIFSAWVATFAKQSITTTALSLGISSGRILGQLGFYVILGMGIITGLRQAGLELDFLTAYLNIIIASLGFAFALSYGLASRKLFENFIGGFYSRDKLQIGEMIKINNLKGRIVAIDATTVSLRTETTTLVIPLGQLTTEVIEKFEEESIPVDEEFFVKNR